MFTKRVMVYIQEQILAKGRRRQTRWCIGSVDHRAILRRFRRFTGRPFVSVPFGLLEPAKRGEKNDEGENIEQNSAVAMKMAGHEGRVDMERKQDQSHDAHSVLQDR